jgi:K+-transporting ATPase KdpF subunit
MLGSRRGILPRFALGGKGGIMSALYVGGAALAAGLLIYLFVALLKPEIFS